MLGIFCGKHYLRRTSLGKNNLLSKGKNTGGLSLLHISYGLKNLVHIDLRMEGQVSIDIKINTVALALEEISNLYQWHILTRS